MTVLRKNGVWLILAAMAGLAGALLVYAIRPASYVSTAQVDVEPHLVESLSPIVPNMGTEEQVATSGLVLGGPARQLHMTYRTLVRHLAATVTGSTATGSTATGTADVLTIGCTMPGAAEAQRCAAAVAGSYIAYRNLKGASAHARVHRPVVAALVTPATFPTAPAGPGLAILLPVGALLALGLGICVIVARDHVDGRVRDRADLERLLEAPVLAAVPRTAGSRMRQVPLSWAAQVCRYLRERFGSGQTAAPGREPSLALGGAPMSPAAEACRYLRERLGPLLNPAPGRGAVVLVAGAGAGQGRTGVAANLAAAFAEAGASVILVDADPGQPSLSETFGTGDRPGLTDLLAGTARLQQVAVQVSDLPGLSVVTAGHLPRPPVSALSYRQLTPVVQSMRAQAEVIIVDGAPLLTASGSIALARASDVVAIIADVRRTRREAVSAAGQQVRATGPRIIAGVLTGVPSPASGAAWRPSAQVPPALSAAPAGEPAALTTSIPLAGPNGHRRDQVSVGQAPQRHRGDDMTPADGHTGSGSEPG